MPRVPITSLAGAPGRAGASAPAAGRATPGCHRRGSGGPPVLDRLERIGPRRHDLHHQGSAVVDRRQRGRDGREVEVPVAQASPRRVGDLHVPEPPAGQANRPGDVGLLDVGVEEVEGHADRRRPDGVEVGQRLARGGHEVGLVAVQGLDRDPHVHPLRVAGGRLHPGHRPRPLRVARGDRRETRLARGEHLDERRADLRGQLEAAPDVVDRDASHPRVGMGEVALGRQPAGRRQRDGREPVIAQPAAEIRGRPAAGFAGKLHAVESRRRRCGRASPGAARRRRSTPTRRSDREPRGFLRRRQHRQSFGR